LKTYKIDRTDLSVTRIAYGCMKLGGPPGPRTFSSDEKAAAIRLIATACEQGITLFDHADIYARGNSEKIFGEAMRELSSLKDKILIQSKCGIRVQGNPSPTDPGRYDFSYRHVIDSVEGSLRRLNADHLDILLLHRPDPLVEPEEVARAFDELHSSGKVRYFGVSNHTPLQIELLQKHSDQPLVVNQLELNLLDSHLIDDGVMANQVNERYAAASGILDYCRLHGILVQAWSPVAQGKLISSPGSSDSDQREVVELLSRMANEKDVPPEAIALGWLLRHPAPVQPIIGTTNPDRIVASCVADRIELSREEWYALFVAARGCRMP